MPDDTNGQGPVGTPQNTPLGDQGTTPLIGNRVNRPHGTGKPDRYIDTLSPFGASVLKAARKMVALARGDAQGDELLNLWMSGTAPDEVTLDSASWGDYMRAEPDLAKQIRRQLENDAWSNVMRAKVDSSFGTVQDDYHGTFHGQVGNKSPMGTPISGGYFTGYELLHGSNRTVGDVQITGKLKAVRVTPSSDEKLSEYNVTFSDLEFVWNDIMDSNGSYSGDPTLKRYAQWENKYTGLPDPADYTVHIKWKATESITISVTNSIQLKQFQP
jgi:hypothetical protein